MYLRLSKEKNLKWTSQRGNRLISKLEVIAKWLMKFGEEQGWGSGSCSENEIIIPTMSLGQLRLIFSKIPKDDSAYELNIYGRFLTDDKNILKKARDFTEKLDRNSFLASNIHNGKWNFHYAWISVDNEHQIVEDFERAIKKALIKIC